MKLLNFLRRNKIKNWRVSQDYELRATLEFMDSDFFRARAQEIHSGQRNASVGFFDDILLKEFFDGKETYFKEFIAHITNRACLDIGPCVATPLKSWDVTNEKFVIEPLFDTINNWQIENYGFSLYEGIKCYPIPAENRIEELVGKIDGVIYCRNCIDHTPHWPFILSNISHYAKSGCKLMLWNDLFHGEGVDDGHYNITEAPENFSQLIEALGFHVVREFRDFNRLSVNWGCFAEKK
ncbi:hypothetical protein [Polynucleobacter sp. MWH-Braz-FAM2G]|uniref:hypothetical protein n=1 Tax=Polynucleobacter sp. MWH-Braz-FAM2G TaxID=1855883 RepID=UPI001BFE67B8|nr:hypothetical protein [Polynucleobacter sp. MWH-Braz-FAM2G]QWD91094.1 hypothetical protein FD973_01780 [Polynucleobacter sp. MWH-Braz-FAM2G]